MDNYTQPEEEFRRYRQRLWHELDNADMHFSIVKSISDASANHLGEPDQARGFWGLTLTSHMWSTLVHLNNLFGSEKRHLHVRGFLESVDENIAVFSREAFENRLKGLDRYNEIAETFQGHVTKEMIRNAFKVLERLPVSGLRGWRNKILSHIDRDYTRNGISASNKHPVKTKDVQEIIEKLDLMLNRYSLGFDFVAYKRGLAGLPREVEFILDAVRAGAAKKKPSSGRAH